MRGLLCVLLLALSGVAPVQAQGKGSAPASGPQASVLAVGVLENFPPLHRWPDAASAPSGFDVDMLEQLAERTGLRFRYVRFHDFVALQQALLDGRIDLTTAIAMTPDRARALRFTRPYMSVQQAFVGSNQLSSVPSTPDLSGRRVAVTRGHVAEAIAAERFPSAARPAYATVDDAVAAVERGEADFVFEALPTLRELIHETSASGLAVLRTFGFPQGHLRIAAPLADAALVRRLDQAIAELPLATVHELRARWFAPPAQLTVRPLAPGAQEAPLRVGYLPGDRPYSLKDADGAAQGIAIEMTKAVARRAGLAIASFEPFELKPGLDALAAGRIDVMLGLTDIAERRKRMGFVGPYRANPVIIVSRKNYTVWSLDQLSGQRLALPAGYFGLSYLRSMYPTVEMVSCPRIEQCFEDVVAGRADAALYGLQGSYERLGARYGTVLQISGTVPALYDEHNLGLARSRAHLAPLLRDALAVVLEQDFAGIEAAWAAREADRGRDRARLRTAAAVAAVALVALALLALLWWWHSKRLGRQVARTNAARQESEHYLAFMAHEVRNALQSVSGAVTMLRSSASAVERSAMFNALSRSANSTLGLLDALLDRRSLQQGRLVVRLGAARLESTLRAVVEETTAAALAKGLAVVYQDGHPPPAGWWLIDELRVQQIVRNLLVNAIKFSAHGRISVSAALRPSARGDDWRRIEIEVRDEGPGLDKATQARLFEPFVAAPSDRPGSGMGLALSRELAQALDGTLTVANHPHGGGAAFVLAFDAQPTAQPTGAARNAVQRLLVVEDSPVYGLLLRQAFVNLGVETVLAESVARARELLPVAAPGASALHFDLVLCDVHLEDGRVEDVVAHLARRSHAASLPLVAMSADADLPTEQHLAQLGVNCLLHKEGDVTVFATRVLERAAEVSAPA